MKNVTSAILGFTLLAGSAFAAQTTPAKPVTSEKTPVAESQSATPVVSSQAKTDAKTGAKPGSKTNATKSHKKQSKRAAKPVTTAQVAPAPKPASTPAK